MKKYLKSKKFRHDLKFGLLLASAIAPFILFGLFDYHGIGWLFYAAWVALVLYANIPGTEKKRTAKFQHYELSKEDIAKVELEETA